MLLTKRDDPSFVNNLSNDLSSVTGFCNCLGFDESVDCHCLRSSDLQLKSFSYLSSDVVSLANGIH